MNQNNNHDNNDHQYDEDSHLLHHTVVEEEDRLEEEIIPEHVLFAALQVWRTLENHYRILDLSSHNLSVSHVDRIVRDVQPLVERTKYNCLEYIWSLNLSNNALSLVPISLQFLVKLERLDLSGNQIICIDYNFEQEDSDNSELSTRETMPVFSRIPLLKILNISSNAIHRLPLHNQCFPDHLRVLDLQFNNLTYLPEVSISNLRHLVRLNLKNNRLSHIPESIGDLSELVELHLNGNDLTYIPQSLEKLRMLRVFSLENNKFDTYRANLIKENIQIVNPLTLEELCKRFIRQHDFQTVARKHVEKIPESVMEMDEGIFLGDTNIFLKSVKKDKLSRNLEDLDVQCPTCHTHFTYKYRTLVKSPGILLPAQKERVPIQWMCCSFDCALKKLTKSPRT